MAMKGKIPSVSRFLLKLGEAIQFRPETEFLSFDAQEETPSSQWGKRLLPYKLKIKTALARMAEQSFFLSLLRRFVRAVFTTRLRSFGILFFSFGFLQLLSYFTASSLPFFAGGVENLLLGVCMIFFTLIASLSRYQLADALKHSFLFRFVLRSLFGLQESDIPEGRGNDRFWPMLGVGVLLGVLSVLFSPLWVILLLTVLIAGLFVLFKPEAGLVLHALLLFVLPATFHAALLLFTLFSFLCKCAVGKRSLRFRPMDLAAALMLLPFLFAARKGVLLYFSLFCVYYLSSCLLRTIDQLRRQWRAYSVAAQLAGLSLVLREIVMSLLPTVFDSAPALPETLFLSPTVGTGVLLAVSLPLSFSLIRHEKGARKLVSVFSFWFALAGIFIVRDPMLWTSVCLVMVVFVSMHYRSGLYLLLLSALALFTVLRVVPTALAAKLLSLFGFSPDGVIGGAETSFFSFLGAGAGWFFGFLILTMILFWVECYRFSQKSVRADMHAAVLGALCATLLFFVMVLLSIPIPEIALFPLLLMLSYPAAAREACIREEVRLPF